MSKFNETEEAIFRSAEMSLVQLFIPLEISRETVYSLGNLGLVQFRDLNQKTNSFQRSFVKELRRLDEVQRQYRFFKAQLDENGIKMRENPYILEDSDKVNEPSSLLRTSDIDDFVKNAEILENRLNQLIDSLQNLQLKNKNLLQHRHILLSGDEFFQQVDDDTAQDFEFVAGLINSDRVPVLEKILWRTLRGNLFFKSVAINEKFYNPTTKEYSEKHAFIVFTHGELLLNKIRKICESLDSDIYDLDVSKSARSKLLTDVNDKLVDITSVLDTTNKTLQAELIALSQELSSWDAIIRKEKAIYESLNLFNYDKNRKVLVAEGWTPTFDLPKLKYYLSNTTLDSSSNDLNTIVNVLSTTKQPPTYHRLNKLTSGFQAICDAYGVPTYREVNPGLATIITFPFMFAIMFGDMGHGFILSLIGFALVWNEKKLGAMKGGDIMDMAFGGRYILLFMGLFSIYTGFLYNDAFSISTSFFKSGWKWPSDFKEGDLIEAEQVGVYAIGIDSAWHGTENGLLFLNSYKMKLSIVMGYLHMLYSFMFSLVNYLNFESYIDIVGNFIPGFLFMNSIFGYLTILIVYKWAVDWIKLELPAPSLLNTLISMFLSPGTIDEQLYSGQASVQLLLVAIALVCVPCLLLIKPLYMKRKLDYEALHHDPENNTANVLDNAEGVVAVADDDDEEGSGHGEEFGDIMIHQVIHTIEFCLNCVSHTASYLRLWALSLAHAQLSQVLWTMTLANSFGMTGLFGVIMTFLLFGMWFVLTCCVLVAMEGTSAMLHSLRLHWVESMSKFFEGEGYPYQPFSFKTVLLEGL